MENLNLILVKKWFLLTLKGIKKEEYRTFNLYWFKRLCISANNKPLFYEFGNDELILILCEIESSPNEWIDILSRFGIRFKDFTITDFRNGYQSLDKCPRFTIENDRITIGKGNPEWGYEGDELVFIIHHGKIINQFNIK